MTVISKSTPSSLFGSNDHTGLSVSHIDCYATNMSGEYFLGGSEWAATRYVGYPAYVAPVCREY